MIYWELFWTFAKIGAFTFGGGYAMLPMIQAEVVSKKHWATDDDILDYFAVGQCTPGVIAVNTASFVGYYRKGIPGCIAATLGVIFPSLVIILVIAALVQIIEIALQKLSPKLYQALGIYLPLITTNCVVLNVCLVNITSAYNFSQMLAYSIGTPLGFALVLYIFSAIRERLEISSVPRPFAGNPIAMIVAAIMAMAFSAFAGLV